MKIRDVKEVVVLIKAHCPSEIGLKHEKSEFCGNSCFDCWLNALDLKENQDKLDNVI